MKNIYLCIYLKKKIKLMDLDEEKLFCENWLFLRLIFWIGFNLDK